MALCFLPCLILPTETVSQSGSVCSSWKEGGSLGMAPALACILFLLLPKPFSATHSSTQIIICHPAKPIFFFLNILQHINTCRKFRTGCKMQYSKLPLIVGARGTQNKVFRPWIPLLSFFLFPMEEAERGRSISGRGRCGWTKKEVGRQIRGVNQKEGGERGEQQRWGQYKT